ncbi:hypothetical protein [Duganella sp. BuS-21]|uniref:hypothetical protein n=1 Tax=Duganella sp. BuS-21 TaxID=2943848 RepID=UPI0035A5CB50
MKLSEDAMLIAIAAGVVVIGAWYVTSNAGKIASAIPGVIADAGAGAVVGVGDILGIPRTDETECEKALREGRTWDASFACPAGTFIGSIFQ